MIESEEVTVDSLINPALAVAFSEDALKPHKLASAKEDWVLLNTNLIKSISAPAWLHYLLDALSLSQTDYNGHDIINPSLAINISSRLAKAHKQSISSEKWVHANEKVISKIGAEAWLWRLLEVLETGNLRSKKPLRKDSFKSS